MDYHIYWYIVDNNKLVYKRTKKIIRRRGSLMIGLYAAALATTYNKVVTNRDLPE